MSVDTFNFYLQFDGDINALRVGDIITLKDGKQYKLTKKTRSAVAVERYYWFDKLYDKHFRKETNEGL